MLLLAVLITIMALIAVLDLDTELKRCSILTVAKHSDIAALSLTDYLTKSQA